VLRCGERQYSRPHRQPPRSAVILAHIWDRYRWAPRWVEHHSRPRPVTRAEHTFTNEPIVVHRPTFAVQIATSPVAGRHRRVPHHEGGPGAIPRRRPRHRLHPRRLHPERPEVARRTAIGALFGLHTWRFGSTCNPIPDANPANSTTRSRLRLTKPRRGRHTADHLQRLNPPDGYADDCPESRVPQDAFPCETSTEAAPPAVLPEPIPGACCYSQMLSRGTFGPSLGATRRLAWRSVAQPRIRSGTRDPSATFRVWGDAQIRLRPGEGRPR